MIFFYCRKNTLIIISILLFTNKEGGSMINVPIIITAVAVGILAVYICILAIRKENKQRKELIEQIRTRKRTIQIKRRQI